MHGVWQRGVIAVVVGCGAVALGAGPAGATMQNMMAYKKAYPDAKSVSCKVCHLDAIGKATNLNVYGKALQAFKGVGQAMARTVEDYQAFDADDLDKDGATNQAEIAACTDPNDPQSVPPATSAQPAAAPGATP